MKPKQQGGLSPGSNEALDKGCTCPVLDNGHGNEELGRTRGFWISGDCPLHGVAINTPNTPLEEATND